MGLQILYATQGEDDSVLQCWQIFLSFNKCRVQKTMKPNVDFSQNGRQVVTINNNNNNNKDKGI